LAGIVVEEDRLGRLSPAYQGRVGRELTEEVGFPGATRSQLNEIEVCLNQRRKTGNEVELQSLRQLQRFESDRPQDHIHPFVAREGGACFDISAEIEPAELDRPQILDVEGIIVDTDRPLNGAWRLGEDRLVARPAAAANRPARP
jgi:hypothetical protein